MRKCAVANKLYYWHGFFECKKGDGSPIAIIEDIYTGEVSHCLYYEVKFVERPKDYKNDASDVIISDIPGIKR